MQISKGLCYSGVCTTSATRVRISAVCLRRGDRVEQHRISDRSIYSLNASGSGLLQAVKLRSRIDVLAAAAATKQAAPPKTQAVQVDDVTAHPVAPGVTLLRASCLSRLKYEVDYGLKRGSTDNTYIITPRGSTTSVLIDVPNEAFGHEDKYLNALETAVELESLSHIILTHLDPKSVPSLATVLKAALAARKAGDGPKLQLVLSNPALQLLQQLWGEEEADKARLLQQVDLVVVKPGASALALPGKLELRLIPTPRWPDLLAVYYPSEQLLFSSKLFSAQVAPSLVPDGQESARDTGGWDEYGNDWRHFFDCMLAPVARQTASALDRLNIEAAAPVGPINAFGRRAQARSGKLISQLLSAWNNTLSNLLTGGAKDGAAPAAPSAGSSKSGSSKGGSGALTAPASPSPASQLRVRQLCPMHGPVVSMSLSRLLREYRQWVDKQIATAGTAVVAVLYASAYGNTAALAQALSRGVTRGDVAVETINLELVELDEVAKQLETVDGFVIGSPTLGGHLPTQVQLALGTLLQEARTRQLPCGVFGSFGWSGEAVDELEKRLKDAGFGFAFDPIRVKFRPTTKDLQVCEESGRALAQAVKRRLKSREVKVASGDAEEQKNVAKASGPQLAMGRVPGSLCVLTAKDEDATSAMLASWVSQASFDPPGLTVSVKKDRALEPLLVTGGKFSLSTVAEGQDKAVMRRLSRPFSPGEDRLMGLETIPSEVTGCPVLKDSNSYLDCQVQARMEAGDHWVVYASVLAGKVLNEAIPTAVHHRKVGNHY